MCSLLEVDVLESAGRFNEPCKGVDKEGVVELV